MISEGKYSATPTAWGLIESEAKNNPEQFAVDFEIGGEGEHVGEQITWFGYFSDAAFEFTMKKIRACGFVGDDLTRLTRATDEPVRITIKHEEYQGKMRAKVAFIDAGSFIEAKRLPADRAASFSAKMRDRIRGFDAKHGSATSPTGARPPSQPRPAAPPRPVSAQPTDVGAGSYDDDIPF